MLIAIVGKKRHGKDTVGGILAKKYELTLDTFARPIKDAARDWFGLSEAQLHGDQKEVVDPRWNRTPREIMQLLGTEVARSIHPDVWARAAMLRHNNRLRPEFLGNRGTVITDCRFPNEAHIIRENGGTLVYVQRPDIEDNEFSAHASERFIEEIGATADHIIVNDTTIEDLREVLQKLVIKGAPT